MNNFMLYLFMNSSRLITKYDQEGTVHDGIKKALKKQDAIDEQEHIRSALESNLLMCRLTKKKEKERIYILSSIYAALMHERVIKSGDKISAIRKTTREPVSVVILTPDGKQEMIPYIEKYLTQDFRLKESLDDSDAGKKLVEVKDMLNCANYFIISKR